MRLYSAALDRTLLARAECVRAERPWMRRWRAAGERMMRAVDRSAWRRLEPGAGDEALLAQTLLEVQACAPRGAPRPRVMHVIGSLAAGGAERQVVYTARETKRCGAADAEIVVLNPLEGAARHYLPLAESGGVAVRVAGAAVDGPAMERVCGNERLVRTLGAVDPTYRAWCTDLAGECAALRPDVVHAWLDHANIWAGIAALAMGVPRVVLSTRNVNPTHFPSLHGPYFGAWYRVLARSPRVAFIANSRAGAEDYAAWMGVDASRFRVVLNGFDAESMRVGDAQALARLRTELGLEGRRVVLGVFRLSEEKHPLVWAEVVRRLLAEHPGLVALHAGDGPMRDALARAMADVPADRFRMLGVRADVGSLMTLATVVLHTSRKEGTPNALLEAQSLGCPVVATAGGGTVDALEDGGSGALCAVDDVEALQARAGEILRDPALRARMSARAAAFVRERFGMERMVRETLDVCGIPHASLGGAP
jgi:glycosyltransferase involved in cell wall biosynthesis